MSGKPLQIFIKDGRDISHPEDLAMLQALYSRNPGSIEDKLADHKEDKAGTFMSKWYVGYGDDSIGDCGTFTMFIENVSMIAAKVIQHHPLYNGQEASTRYLDFSQQGFVDPLHRPDIMERMLDGYQRILASVKERLNKDYPYTEQHAADGVNKNQWDRAINARAFDIARGFLPCGMKTSLSWMTTIRNARDHVLKMRTHPSKELVFLARDLYSLMVQSYPTSFKSAVVVPSVNYFDTVLNKPSDRDEEYKYTWWSPLRKQEIDYLIASTTEGRTRRQPLHVELDAAVMLKVNWELDFASFRDLQRHRNMRMPLPIIERHNSHFHRWYIEEAGEVAEDYADEMLKLNPIVGPDCETQYYMPMASTVPVQMTMHLGQALYLVETRSSRMVHPTLRPLAQDLGEFLLETFPNLPIHIDRSEEEINLRRGKQDIVKKETVA